MTDKEAQEDELLALASIYDTEVFSTTLDSDGVTIEGGQFAGHLDLPQPFYVNLEKSKKGTKNGAAAESDHEEYLVKYLPPVMLFFELPADYPSKQPPRITLSCKWLTLQQLSKLCRRLDEIWQENEGDVILFMWTSFLKDDVLEFLEIQTPLDLTKVVAKRPRRSRCDSTSSSSSAKEDVPSGEVNGACAASADVSATSHDTRVIQDIGSQSLLLPTILEHDKRQQELDFLSTLFTCQVCFMEKLGALCISFAGCGHVYCKECMRGYFEVQIGEGNVKALTCPNSECESQAHPAQVKELVSPEQFARYDRLLLQSSLDTMSDIVYCPRKLCECAVMVDVGHSMGSCPACHYTFCIFCKLTYHGISPCKIRAENVIKLREEYNAANPKRKAEMERRYGRRAMQQIIEESYSTEYLEKEARKCPHCATWISKIDGCNKMTCTKCRTYFCWLCQKRLPKQNPYSHFSAPGSQCFNQLFQGMEQDDDDDDPDFFLDELGDGSDLDDDELMFVRVL